MAEKVWMVHVETWEMKLMYVVDAKEAVHLGDYIYAPVGGYDPPTPRQRPTERSTETAA